ncbi:MAG TPA: amidohydrolase family protein [Acidimicrobiales bacterium]|nr:amidohydrolase family protein [Acidimicrobiales bacterium]
MSTYDLAIMGGIVVDGTGLARRRGDIGIKDGRIMKVGFVQAGEADEVIDADGLHVAPGIVDAHTHYDPQLTFEPHATSSCYHGVTTVLAGNCGFSVAPNRPSERDYLARMFAKVEGMSPVALSAVQWDFETFAEFLRAREGRLGVNMACYVGHSAVRRTVMGEAGSEREATDDEIEQMRSVVAGAMEAGAAGFSSSHGPTQLDGDERPVPSRFASLGELEVLCAEAGRHRGGSISYLHRSAIGGLDADDKELLVRLGSSSRLPIILQGLGGRSKVDVPGAGWEEVAAWIDEAGRQGVGIYSLLRNHPFDRDFRIDSGTNLYEGVPAWHRVLGPGATTQEKLALLSDPAQRAEMRGAVEHPNTDASKGSTLPPPRWKVVEVDEVTHPEHEKYLHRTIADIAEELGKDPADAMVDLAVAEDLETVFRYVNKSRSWEEAVAVGQRHPSMVIGVSDGGAHLDRDDGSDWSTAFLAFWVRDRKLWSLEEGIRQLTQVPAALLGFEGRGMLLPGYAADAFVFDPDTVELASKKQVRDFPGGEARYSARPKGVYWTIVNGVPIVRDGEVLTENLPGQVVRPGIV